jgi:molybdate transport system substrate-binding protein
MKTAGLVLLILSILPGLGCRRTERVLTVSAASDLTEAFSELGRLFTEESGIQVRFNFGSTGQLAQQIEQGAPVDLFAAASLDYVEELERKGRLQRETRQIYGIGRLALWQRANSRVRIESLAELRRPESGRIAMANPEHAPYGRAAREALQAAGLWEEVRPRLVLGENVRQALQYAASGDVEVAIVALALCVAGKAKGDQNGRWSLIPATQHRPLRQAVAVVTGAASPVEAKRFIDLVTSEKGRKVLDRYGFERPPKGSP